MKKHTNTLQFKDCSKQMQRSILRKYLNKELRDLRGVSFIDGDFKWLMINYPEKAFSLDPTDIINLNRGAIIKIANVSGVASWQRVYGYVHHLSEVFDTDVLMMLSVLIQLVRVTPRGISRTDAWSHWDEFTGSTGIADCMVKTEFTPQEVKDYGIDLTTSVINNYLHINNLNTNTAITKGILSRVMNVAKKLKLVGLTVNPLASKDRKFYISIGFEVYTVDGLLRYTIK